MHEREAVVRCDWRRPCVASRALRLEAAVRCRRPGGGGALRTRPGGQVPTNRLAHLNIENEHLARLL